MRTKLLLALLVSGALLVPGVALAKKPTCLGVGTPGDVNKLFKDVIGTPGQVQATFGVPANEYAKARNNARKAICFP